MTKTVLITGASSGFGNLTAKTFQREGWNVVATMRSPEKEQELTNLKNMLVTHLDVTDPASIDEAVEKTLQTFGSIDVLVNNAGFGGIGHLEQHSEQQVFSLFNTNVFGVVRVSQAVLPLMRRKKGGTIINVTSSAGYFGLPLYSIYCASKFAAEGLTESMAQEYASFNIAVKAIAPGGYGTSFNASTDNNLQKGDDELQQSAQKIAAQFATSAAELQRQSGAEADPQEVADKVLECATSDAPVHNVCGADAERIVQMLESMPRQEFVEAMSDMVTPRD